MEELKTKIYEIGILITALSGRFYFVEAPQKCARPYSVFSFFANPTDDRDTANKFEKLYLQINHYSDSYTQAETIAEASKALFDDGESRFTGLTEYHLDAIDRVSVPRRTKLNLVWQITEQYKLELTKT